MTRVRTSLLAATSFAALTVAMAGCAGASELSTLLDSFAVLAGSTITNTGPTTIDGNIGLSPGTSIVDSAQITLIPPSTIHQTDSVAAEAQVDLGNAFTTLMNLPSGHDLTGQGLGGMVLTAGVYSFGTIADLTGTLTLNAEGNPNAVFIIQVGSALNIAGSSHVVLENGAQGANVYWVVGSAATIGTNADFSGEILAYSAITLQTGATITCGAALAETAGAVTLDTNVITSQCAFAGFGGGSTATGNAGAIAAALDAYVAAGGILPPALEALLNGLTSDELTAALIQLSGETGTAVAPAATQGMNSFLSTLFDSAFVDNRSETPGPSPSTVRALDYASERTPSSGPAAALAPLDPSYAPGRWGVWAAGYGGSSTTSGDATVGSHDTSSTIFGISAGFDQHVGADSIVGIALGAGRSNFSVADGLGSGSDSMLQAALYARTNLGRAYVASAVAYSYNAITTERDINLPTTPATIDHFSTAFAGNDVAGQVEVGYRLKWLIPYAAVRAQEFFTPAYSETATENSGLGLSYAAQTSTAFRTELGLRVAHTFPVAATSTLTLSGRAAWAHDYGGVPYVTAAFQSIPGTTFVIHGAAPARDSVLLSAGAELGFADGFAVAGLFDSAFSSNSSMYSGTGRVSYRW